MHIFPLPLSFALSYPYHVCVHASLHFHFSISIWIFHILFSLFSSLLLNHSAALRTYILSPIVNILSICIASSHWVTHWCHHSIPTNVSYIFFYFSKPEEIECADNKIHYASSSRGSGYGFNTMLNQHQLRINQFLSWL